MVLTEQDAYRAKLAMIEGELAALPGWRANLRVLEHARVRRAKLLRATALLAYAERRSAWRKAMRRQSAHLAGGIRQFESCASTIEAVYGDANSYAETWASCFGGLRAQDVEAGAAAQAAGRAFAKETADRLRAAAAGLRENVALFGEALHAAPAATRREHLVPLLAYVQHATGDWRRHSARLAAMLTEAGIAVTDDALVKCFARHVKPRLRRQAAPQRQNAAPILRTMHPRE
ncbi:MAG: hypothetical protein ACRD2F_00090 [Terriglobales bacterium]